MSIDEWTQEGIRSYELAIAEGDGQKAAQEKRREQWLNNFIDGHDMRGMPFDEFIYGHYESTANNGGVE